MGCIAIKKLYFAWVIACLFTIFLILSFAISLWFLIISIIFMIMYIVISFKYLNCPNCNKSESLINLTYAVNHRYYCRYCGEKITIGKEEEWKITYIFGHTYIRGRKIPKIGNYINNKC